MVPMAFDWSFHTILSSIWWGKRDTPVPEPRPHLYFSFFESISLTRAFSVCSSDLPELYSPQNPQRNTSMKLPERYQRPLPLTARQINSPKPYVCWSHLGNILRHGYVPYSEFSAYSLLTWSRKWMQSLHLQSSDVSAILRLGKMFSAWFQPIAGVI